MKTASIGRESGTTLPAVIALVDGRIGHDPIFSGKKVI